MEYRPFGRTGLSVSALGVGCGRLGAVLRTGTSREAMQMLLQALDQGVTFYDTADSYGQGMSEELLGRAFSRRREHVVIATKVGYRFSKAMGLASRIKPLIRPLVRSVRPLQRSIGAMRSAQMSQDFSAQHICAAVDRSLSRLGSDHIDVYQLHSPPQEVLLRGEFIPVFEKLKAAGKIRAWGVSCLSVEDALLCLRYREVSSVQVTINALQQEALASLLPSVTDAEVAVIARQPLAAGTLAGVHPRTGEGNGSADEAHLALLSALRSIQIPGRRSIAQTAIRFVLQQRGVSVVAPGTTTVGHLEENLGAIVAPALSREEIETILSLAR